MQQAHMRKLLARAEEALQPRRRPIIVRALSALRAKLDGTECAEPFTDEEIDQVLEVVGTKDSLMIDSVAAHINVVHKLQ